MHGLQSERTKAAYVRISITAEHLSITQHQYFVGLRCFFVCGFLAMGASELMDVAMLARKRQLSSVPIRQRLSDLCEQLVMRCCEVKMTASFEHREGAVLHNPIFILSKLEAGELIVCAVP